MAVAPSVERTAAEPGFRRFAAECLARFIRGDRGELCAEDQAANEAADETGGQVVGNYPLPPALAHHRQPGDATAALWVIRHSGPPTGPVRLTVLFPSDYWPRPAPGPPGRS